MHQLYRGLPSVDACLTALQADGSFAAAHRQLKELVQHFLDTIRSNIAEGKYSESDQLTLEALWPDLRAHVERGLRPNLRKVLNGAGVVIHTNLGRSVLAEEAVQAVTMAAGNYSSLEFDLDTGERGSRHSLVEGLICSLTGAEAALVVNNNAAAVLLMLDSLCKGTEVIVSRGQLVEIGGSFRIPEVMARGGAALREVGTTNRTHRQDYERAITGQTSALLRVHTSNYRVIGFTSTPDLHEMAELAHARGLLLLEDLGSGSLLDFSPWGLPDEPTVQDVVKAGADVVTFSGDKVLGGPQAGIIAGKKACIDKIRSNQLLRALRCDKLCLAALEATLRLYMDTEEAKAKIPTVSMLTMEPEQLRKKAAKLRESIQAALSDKQAQIDLLDDVSRVGGGSFPERDLPTTLVRIRPAKLSLQILRQKLLQGDPPLVGRIEQDCFCLDPRCLKESEFKLAADLLAAALN